MAVVGNQISDAANVVNTSISNGATITQGVSDLFTFPGGAAPSNIDGGITNTQTIIGGMNLAPVLLTFGFPTSS